MNKERDFVELMGSDVNFFNIICIKYLALNCVQIYITKKTKANFRERNS